MTTERPQNPLHERYASAEMGNIFSSQHRYALWRDIWIALAETQQELGLDISSEQIAALREAAPRIDLDRVAVIERATRHDVVSHLRHFAEQAGDAGGILHLGATSAFVTDNTDCIILREGLEILSRRLVSVMGGLAAFARNTKEIPALAFTHFQAAQLTTIGKRACVWMQDFLIDYQEIQSRLAGLRCRGAKGTTGTQASYLTLFAGDHEKVRELDRRFTAKIGFGDSFPVTGQTYPRKQDSQILATLAGVAESCHKLGTDVRLLQGIGELAEPFEEKQVGSSAMPYKRNPIRAERMCSLSRRLMTDSLNGPLTAATQWLERSLDDSANRRLVVTDSFLTADAVISLAANIASRLTVREVRVRTNVERELPFLTSETILMMAAGRGGDRQILHERIRDLSMEAHAAVEQGEPNPLLELIAADPSFGLTRDEIVETVDPVKFVGRAPEQVEEFLTELIDPILAEAEALPVEEPHV